MLCLSLYILKQTKYRFDILFALKLIKELLCYLMIKGNELMMRKVVIRKLLRKAAFSLQGNCLLMPFSDFIHLSTKKLI